MPSLNMSWARSHHRRANAFQSVQNDDAVKPVVTLGLSVMSDTTELVMIRGHAARGPVLDRVVTAMRGNAAASGSHVQQTVDNVLQTQALAIAHGYHVHAVGVICDGAKTSRTNGLITALEDAGLNNVTTLNPAVAREIFTQREIADVENAVAGHTRSHIRRRRTFVAAMIIAVAALAFAIVDRLAADPRPGPDAPVVTPALNTATPNPPAVETAPQPTSAPPGIPAQNVPPADPPAPVYPPPREAPAQRSPAQRPPPPPIPPSVEPPEPVPSDNCMLLCGVTI
jgi:hypothetical protein